MFEVGSWVWWRPTDAGRLNRAGQEVQVIHQLLNGQYMVMFHDGEVLRANREELAAK
jgi:hypothetical protein